MKNFTFLQWGFNENTSFNRKPQLKALTFDLNQQTQNLKNLIVY